MPHLVQNVYLRSDIPAETGPVKVVKKMFVIGKKYMQDLSQMLCP